MSKKQIILVFFAILLPSALAAQTYEQLVESGLRAAQADSLEVAESLYKQAIRMAPDDYRNALAYHDLGHVQEMLYWKNPSVSKKYEEALFNYSRAVEMQPTAIPIVFSRANFYLNLKNYGKAIHDYSSILEMVPNNIEALNCRAFAYFQQREYERARADYENVLRLKASDSTAALGVALVLQKTNKFGEAIKRMDFLVAEYPERDDLLSVRASMLSDRGQNELALIDMDRAIELSPSNPAYYLQRAEIYEKKGNKKLATRDRRMAARLSH